MWTTVGILGHPWIYISKSSNSPHFTRSKPEFRGGVQGSSDAPYWSQHGPHPMSPLTSVGLQEIFQHLWPLVSPFVKQERWIKSMLEVFSSSEHWCAASVHSITTWNDPTVIALPPNASLWKKSGKAQLIGPHRPCWDAIEHKMPPITALPISMTFALWLCKTSHQELMSPFPTLDSGLAVGPQQKEKCPSSW